MASSSDKSDPAKDLPDYNHQDTPSCKIWAMFRHAHVLDEKGFREFLTKFDLDVNMADQKGSTALHVAAEKDSPEAVKTLLACGADMESAWMTGLAVAASSGNINCLKAFIKAGADVNAKDIGGSTALFHALENGHVDAVRALIEAGANVNHVNYDGDTPLIRLAKNQSYSISDHSSIGDPLCTSVKAGQELRKKLNSLTDVLEVLLTSGADANMQNEKGRSALMSLFTDLPSQRQMHTYTTELLKPCSLLIRHKADVNLQDKDGMTALMHAAAHNVTVCCELLLKHNADINMSDEKGMSALMHTLKDNMLESCRILIQNGSDVNSQDSDGQTPLMHYIWRNTPEKEMLDFLLQQDLELDIQDSKGRTALMYAASRNIGFCCNRLVAQKCGVNIQDRDGRTALMHAIIFDSNECFSPLLGPHSDINVQDGDGRTALMYVVLHDSPVLQTLLQKRECRFNECDMGGRNAADYATDPAFLDILLSAGVAKRHSDTMTCPVAVLLLKDIKHRHAAPDIRGQMRRYRKVNRMLQVNTTPLLLESSQRLMLQELHYEDDSMMKMFVEENLTHTIQLLIHNGVAMEPRVRKYHEPYHLSPLLQASLSRHLDIAKYIMANSYLTENDMNAMRKARDSSDTGRLWLGNDECHKLLKQATSQPWPLVKLAFIAVNTIVSRGPDREGRILKTQLPARLQRCLMFQEHLSLLPVNEWSTIELCFDPEEYEKLPKPRPLLYYWPFGKMF